MRYAPLRLTSTTLSNCLAAALGSSGRCGFATPALLTCVRSCCAASGNPLPHGFLHGAPAGNVCLEEAAAVFAQRLVVLQALYRCPINPDHPVSGLSEGVDAAAADSVRSCHASDHRIVHIKSKAHTADIIVFSTSAVPDVAQSNSPRQRRVRVRS